MIEIQVGKNPSKTAYRDNPQSKLLTWSSLLVKIWCEPETMNIASQLRINLKNMLGFRLAQVCYHHHYYYV